MRYWGLKGLCKTYMENCYSKGKSQKKEICVCENSSDIIQILVSKSLN